MRDQRRPQQSRSIRAILSSAILIGTSSIAACGLVDGSEGGSAATTRSPWGWLIDAEEIGQTFAPHDGEIECFFHRPLGGKFGIQGCPDGKLCVPAAENEEHEVRGICVAPGELEAGEACAEYGSGKPTDEACQSGKCERVASVMYWGIDPYLEGSDSSFPQNNRYTPHAECVGPEVVDGQPPEWAPTTKTTSTNRGGKTFSQICKGCDLNDYYCVIQLDPDVVTQNYPGTDDYEKRYGNPPRCVPKTNLSSRTSRRYDFCDGKHALQTIKDRTCAAWSFCKNGKNGASYATLYDPEHMSAAEKKLEKDAETWFREHGTDAQCTFDSEQRTEVVTQGPTTSKTYCTANKTWTPEAIEKQLIAAAGAKALGEIRGNIVKFGCADTSRWCSAVYRQGSDYLQLDFERAPGWDTVHIRHTGDEQTFASGIRLLANAFAMQEAPSGCPDEGPGAPVEDRSSPAEPPQTAADDSKDDKDLPWWKKGTTDLSWMDQDRG